MKKRSFFSVFGGILVSAVIIFLLYYTMLPAINLKSQDFIIFLILSTLIILTVNFITYMKEFLSGLGKPHQCPRPPEPSHRSDPV